MLIDEELEYYRNHFGKLEQENKQLREEIAELKDTVFALVARNIKAKPNKIETKKKKISRHARKSRSRPIHIDNTITVDQKECNICQAKLSNPTDSYTRIVEDIIPAKAIITQYTIS